MSLIKTQPSGGGYLLLDHRNCDDVPAGLPRIFEADTYTCTHCSGVVVMNPARTRERYKCRGCSHHICDSCAAQRVAGGPCRTVMQQADELMAAAERQARAETSLILP